jgi:hypothetical protein
MTQEGRFGYSPDSGEFQIRDHKAYWEDGHITDMDVGVFRWIPITTPRERYADWTDAQRLEAQKQAYAARQQLQRQLGKDSQVEIPDSALYRLDTDQLEIIVEALWTFASQSRDLCADDYNGHLAKISALVDHMKAGGEAP